MQIDSQNSENAYINMKIDTSRNAEVVKREDKEFGNDEKMNYEGRVVSIKKGNEQEVINAIEKANKHIRSFDRRLEFSIHETTKQIMVKVINTEDDTVVREIPSEKILDMVAHMWEVAGILIDEKR